MNMTPEQQLLSRTNPEALLTDELRKKGFTKCDLCHWFLNRCSRGCQPETYQAEDRAMWTI